MKPVIGVTTTFREERLVVSGVDYYNSVASMGGLPVIFPNLMDEVAITQYAEMIDGLLVTGGGDIDPSIYGEQPHPGLGEVSPQRDFFEIALVQKVLQLNKPILGLCRGCQVINVAMGGDVYQDIYAQSDTPLLQHRQKAPRSHASHDVDIDPQSILYQIIQKPRIKVNSFHHQAVRKIGGQLKVSARSDDGIIEAIESKAHRFVLATQWHPENLLRKDDPASVEIFQAFVKACSTK